MKFIETKIQGVLLIDIEPVYDSRGMFARTYCLEEFKTAGLNFSIYQTSTSLNLAKHTIRGMHFQLAPYAEQKLVRCTAGEIYDVLLDLRPESPTHLKWMSVELSGKNNRMVFIPPGVAHGYQTLVENSEILYMIDTPFEPTHYRGARWNDPAFAIDWPATNPIVISDRDNTYPDYGK